MRKWKVAVLFGGIVLVAVGAFVVHSDVLHAGSKVHVGRPCAASNRPAVGEVDHAAYDALLRKYVDDRGLIAYASWKADADDVKALDDYLALLSCVDLRKPASNEARLAYWINAYNAVTLRGILREYPTSSIRNHAAKLAGYNIWKDLLLWVDGRRFSLDDIEHQTLRKMGEPRIHFALVCASKGCPPLLNRAYAAEQLDTQLAANARRFFARPENFRADAASRTVWLSSLLSWYGSDFASGPREQLRLLRPYLPAPENLAWVEGPGVQVRYLDYDWSLNDQQSQSR